MRRLAPLFAALALIAVTLVGRDGEVTRATGLADRTPGHYAMRIIVPAGGARDLRSHAAPRGLSRRIRVSRPSISAQTIAGPGQGTSGVVSACHASDVEAW